MKLLSVLALAFFTSTSAHAAAVHSCENLDSIGNLIGNVRSFAQGSIRVAHISTEEPAAAPDHLLVFVTEEEGGGVECFAVSATKDGLGFSGIELPEMKVDYDAGKGLLLNVPVFKYDHDSGESKPDGTVKVRVSRKGGVPKVTLE